MSNAVTLTSQMAMAERELGAFLHAVSELYGPVEAAIAVQDWLQELERLPFEPEPTPREWRALTVAAAVKLSKRVSRKEKELTVTS